MRARDGAGIQPERDGGPRDPPFADRWTDGKRDPACRDGNKNAISYPDTYGDPHRAHQHAHA